MSLTAPEDAATVLEQFVHDSANVPAEITHLLEEIQAKDLQIQALKDEINKRDAQLQKWVRVNGGHVANPKEEAFSKTISDCYDKCEILQAEKCGLGDRAMMVLDRQVKRLDIGLRSLAQTEQFPSDWGGPSLLTAGGNSNGANTPANGVSAAGMPLQAISGNIGHGSNITVASAGVPNPAQMRLGQTGSGPGGRNSAGGSQTPTSHLPRNQREGSSEAASKKRRLNLGTLPASSSNLRQSSLGPGTPKAGTPGPGGSNSAVSGLAVGTTGTGSSRAGSAQPSRPAGGATSGSQKKGPGSIGPSSSRKTAPPPSRKGAGGSGRVRNVGGGGGGGGSAGTAASKKLGGSTTGGGGGGGADRRRQLARGGANTPSTNASVSGDDEDDDEDDSASPTPSSLPRGSQADGAGDKDDGDDADDDQIYCICQKVSFGDMVGCDNELCEYQWFHYKCVGVTEEPVGEWLCPTCRNLPKGKLRVSKD